MLDWLRAPALYDAILLMLVVEGVVLSRWIRSTGRGLSLPQLASFLGAGAGFTLACRSLAAGWPAWTLAPALSAAFVCHLLHLRARR
ncbi:MAG: hypothetical protein H7099_20855 [Gemmatimonadaceae bacterium]|nr:hypothetical protein [Gemmatimonadaceae bacterium]